MEFDFSITYDTGEKDFSGLDLYYGSKSLQGVGETISIASEGIVNESYISRTTARKGIDIDFKASFIGSFKQRFSVKFTTEESVRNLVNLTPKSYIELMQYLIGQAIGNNYIINRRNSKKKFSEMYFSEDIAHRLTSAIKDIHLPVKYQGYKATLLSAQTIIAVFDHTTLAYLDEEIESKDIEIITVGISRFNARTGTGRLIQEIDGDSFSFQPSHQFTKAQKTLLVRSLHGTTQGTFYPLLAHVKKISANNGTTKYYVLHKVETPE